VPTLIVKDKTVTKKALTLCESMAICEYLEEAYPSKRKLLPKDAAKRCKVRQLCEIINSGTQPVQNMSVLTEVGTRFGAEHKQPWAAWAIARGLTALEAQLEQTKGKFCLGNILTLADVFLPAQVYNAERWKVDMSQFPAVMSVLDNLKTIPEFAAAHPSQQPDCEE
jgi:maleylacetoacetate isomerase